MKHNQVWTKDLGGDIYHCPQIIVSVHAPVEITKPNKTGLRYAVLEAGVLFLDFERNESSNNPEKNSNTRYSSQPQHILWGVVGT